MESDRAISDVAEQLLARLRAQRTVAARLVGVALSNFSRARDAEQLAMFGGALEPADVPERARDRDLSRAMDRVRARFGDDAIRTGPARTSPIGEKGARKPRH